LTESSLLLLLPPFGNTPLPRSMSVRVSPHRESHTVHHRPHTHPFHLLHLSMQRASPHLHASLFNLYMPFPSLPFPSPSDNIKMSQPMIVPARNNACIPVPKYPHGPNLPQRHLRKLQRMHMAAWQRNNVKQRPSVIKKHIQRRSARTHGLSRPPSMTAGCQRDDRSLSMDSEPHVFPQSFFSQMLQRTLFAFLIPKPMLSSAVRHLSNDVPCLKTRRRDCMP
jgi:hypothetical protein